MTEATTQAVEHRLTWGEVGYICDQTGKPVGDVLMALTMPEAWELDVLTAAAAVVHRKNHPSWDGDPADLPTDELLDALLAGAETEAAAELHLLDPTGPDESGEPPLQPA